MSEFGRIEITGSKRAGFPEIAERCRQCTKMDGVNVRQLVGSIYTLWPASHEEEKREFALRQQARPDSQKSETEDSLLLRLLRIQCKYIHQGLTALLVPFWVIGCLKWEASSS